MEVHYRSAVPEDAAACIELRGKTRENAFSAEALAAVGITVESWRNGIEAGLTPGFVAMAAGRMIGYCFGDKTSGEILVLALLPEAEGSGIGKALLHQTVECLRNLGHHRLFLGCSPDPAHRSHGFYRRMGWKSTGKLDSNQDEILEFFTAPTHPPVKDDVREQFHHAVREALHDPHGSAPARLVDVSGRVNQTAVSFNVFSTLLRTDGVRAALYSLLRRTDYRFISIFRFQDGKATSAVHVDREDLKVQQAAEVDDTATYCCYVRDRNGAFVTADAMTDPRTQDHPAREVVRAYCGIPILDPEGGLIGTLCHYDLQPRDPGQLDLELLLQAASALSAPGVVPPYPEALNPTH